MTDAALLDPDTRAICMAMALRPVVALDDVVARAKAYADAGVLWMDVEMPLLVRLDRVALQYARVYRRIYGRS